VADAGDKGNEGADDGHEAREDDGAAAVFLEEGVRAFEVLAAEEAGVLPLNTAGPRRAPMA
jgi:hypothetical protein